MTSGRWVLALAAVLACACAPPLRDPSLGRDDGAAGRVAGAAGQAGAAAGTAASSRAGTGGDVGAAGTAFGGQSGGAAVPGPGTGPPGSAGMGTIPGAAGTGAPAPIDLVRPGPACGKPLPLDQPPTVPGTAQGYKRYTIVAQGQTLAGPMPMKAGPRSFWVRVPADYDPKRPYRVVYLGQGCGGFNMANVSTYPLYKEALGGTEQAIYVAVDLPTDLANMDCYDTLDGTASQELEAFELINDVVVNTYCVDENRVFAAGFGTGGALAGLWGCYFSGDGMTPAGAPGMPRRFSAGHHVRAQAVIYGAEVPNSPACNGPVAAFFLSDELKDSYPAVLPGLARVGRMNGCNTDLNDRSVQVPWHSEVREIGNVCTRFRGCPIDYPVVFCKTSGLGQSDQATRVVPALDLFFSEIGQPTP